MKNEEKVSYPEFLRMLAAFMEAHPLLPQPTIYGFDDAATFYLSKDKVKETLQLIGSFEKQFSGDEFYAKKRLGGWELKFNADRSAVCKKVVTGKRIVPETYVEGTKSHFVPEHEEEIVEWQCDEPILSTEAMIDDAVRDRPAMDIFERWERSKPEVRG